MHTLGDLALTKAVPAVVTAAPKTADDKNHTSRFKHVGSDRNDRNGNQKGGVDSSPTVLATIAVPAPQPTASPQPVVAIPLPSVSPPSPVATGHAGGDDQQGTSWLVTTRATTSAALGRPTRTRMTPCLVL